jgi:hypothetical protein
MKIFKELMIPGYLSMGGANTLAINATNKKENNNNLPLKECLQKIPTLNTINKKT